MSLWNQGEQSSINLNLILTFRKVIRTVWEWTGIRYHKPRQWKIKLDHIEILKFWNFQKIIWKKKLTNLFYSFCISFISFYSLAIVCAKSNLDLVTWCTFFLFIEQTVSFGWAWFVPKFVSNAIVRLVFFLQDVKSWSVLVYYFYDNQSHHAQNVMPIMNEILILPCNTHCDFFFK